MCVGRDNGRAVDGVGGVAYRADGGVEEGWKHEHEHDTYCWFEGMALLSIWKVSFRSSFFRGKKVTSAGSVVG